jgi:hypothetical protein
MAPRNRQSKANSDVTFETPQHDPPNLAFSPSYSMPARMAYPTSEIVRYRSAMGEGRRMAGNPEAGNIPMNIHDAKKNVRLLFRKEYRSNRKSDSNPSNGRTTSALKNESLSGTS